jgi:hypothetical protein
VPLHVVGATGLTFYDDEVRKLFETDLEQMLAVALRTPDAGDCCVADHVAG